MTEPYDKGNTHGQFIYLPSGLYPLPFRAITNLNPQTAPLAHLERVSSAILLLRLVRTLRMRQTVSIPALVAALAATVPLMATVMTTLTVLQPGG